MALKKQKGSGVRSQGSVAKRSATKGSPVPHSPFPIPRSRFVKSYNGRGFYKTVWGPDIVNRPFATAETGDELQALPASERNRLISLARNTARNSERMEGILEQLELNVIGDVAGKATFTAPEGYERQFETIHRAFANWAMEAEYFDDANLQELLKRILRTLYIGGDMALVFDNRVTRGDSGQIIGFEPDCIGNLAESDFKEYFPNYSQHQGIVKDANGKTVGVIVSWSQRGQSEYRLFDEDGRRAAWVLIKRPGERWDESPFTMLRNFNRINQMRGCSPLWTGLGTIADGAALQGYEVQASKRNAQIMGQVLQGESETSEGELAAELDPDATAPLAVDENDTSQEAAVAEAIEQQRLDLDDLSGKGGLIWDLMPPGVKAEIFDTKHPNQNLREFSNWLHSGAAFSAGLTSLFATGKADASYSAAMAEMILAQTKFRVEFHRLECGFLDWALANWSRRAQARGIIPQDSELPEDWRRTCVKWQRPQERALNPVDEQNAVALGLKNLTRNYHETLGPDWKRKLLETAEEIKFATENGIPDPRLQTVSGEVITNNKEATNG